MTITSSAWKRNVAVTVALVIAWIVLITIEVKAGIVDELKAVYLITVVLALGGFIWAWLPAELSKNSSGEISALRVAGLSVAATAIAMAISLLVGMNYKFAIGGVL